MSVTWPQCVARLTEVQTTGSGFLLLLELLDSSSSLATDRSLKIVCAQTMVKLSRGIRAGAIESEVNFLQ